MKKQLIGLMFIIGFTIFACDKDEVIPTEEVGASLDGILDQTRLVATGARITELGTGFGFTEGPAKDKNGNIFFTDQPNDKIHKWSVADNKVSTFVTVCGRSNGMAFDKDGNLITCADYKGELRKYKPDGTFEILVKDYNGKLLNGPNDVWINPITGGMYITDPIFPRGYWDAGDPRQQPWEPKRSEQAATGKGGHVYYLAPGAKTLTRVTTMAEWEADSWPNGVVGTPDGKKLYVNKWAGNNRGGTWVFDVNADGTLTNIKKFTAMGGDGMAMDEKGNVYISNGFGITAFNPSGNRILNIPIAGATNCSFAGADNKTLFITGPTNAINSVKMNVKGSE